MNISELSLREKIGQMFMVGVMDEKHLQTVLSEYHVGGIIHFSRNGQNAKEGYEFFKRAKSLSKHPLITTIDQEGGIVTRIKEGVTPISGNMAIGATGRIENAEITAEIMANELMLLGANMNLAPVVDVNVNPDNPVINVRSYGEDPDKVSEYALAALKGYKKNGMLAVAKHFPGHGDTVMDSHFDLPVVDHPIERLHEVELKPFRAMIEHGIDSIMISHVMFKTIDDERPATLSRKVVTDLLRDALGYDGLIMTDCMEMHAVAKRYRPQIAAVEAIRAGADLILYSSQLDTQIASMEAVYKAVKEGIITEAQIDASVERIIRYKSRITNDMLPWHEVESLLRKEVSLSKTMEIAKSSITVRGEEPFDLATCTQYVIPKSELLHKEFPEAVSYDELNPDENAIVFYRNLEELKSIISNLDSKKTVLVALRAPYGSPKGFTTIYTYELTELAISALCSILEGEPAKGILPVSEVV